MSDIIMSSKIPEWMKEAIRDVVRDEMKQLSQVTVTLEDETLQPQPTAEMVEMIRGIVHAALKDPRPRR